MTLSRNQRRVRAFVRRQDQALVKWHPIRESREASCSHSDCWNGSGRTLLLRNERVKNVRTPSPMAATRSYSLRWIPLLGDEFLNRTLIPTLCKKAGVDIHDAKGKILGHRGRSTRLTLLRRNGVNLDDLAEYAKHSDTKTIRRNARPHPLQLHRIIRDANHLSCILEGVVDIQAAAQGLPALRWLIGYNADGDPMYCGNQVYHTCPHGLDCVKCGMFIGGEKAKPLHEGEAMLPSYLKSPNDLHREVCD